jgi:enoyl-[acyl-carrier protein] reductase II
MQLVTDERVPVVFTSAGSPSKWTGRLKEHGIKVVHVVSSSHFAQKAEQAGVDAIVAEGYEAGGHNGREETTTLSLLPAVRRVTSLPLIAAGGIVTGAGMLAVQALGAEGVQLGTRFALTRESSAHEAFKQLCLNLQEGDTRLLLRKLSPVRLVRSTFKSQVEAAEAAGATEEELRTLLGKGRAKQGIFQGDLEQGELEIGQAASILQGKEIQTVNEVFTELLREYQEAVSWLKQSLC